MQQNTNPICGYLMIRCIDWNAAPPMGCSELTRNPAINLSPLEVHSTYKGIDGEILQPDRTLLSPDAVTCLLQESDINHYRKSPIFASHDVKIRILYCDWTLAPTELVIVERGLTFLGYDISSPPSNFDRFTYSAIFHELIYGSVPDLIAFDRKLNKSLLFDNVPDSQSFVAIRSEIKNAGGPVEDGLDQPITPVAVYE